MPSKDDILLEEAFEQKPMSRATFLRLLSYVSPYRRLFRFNLLLTLMDPDRAKDDREAAEAEEPVESPCRVTVPQTSTSRYCGIRDRFSAS